MIHIIKNYKWVIASSLISVLFGLLTFFTFIDQSFISLNNLNLQILLIADLCLLILFFVLIIFETYKILKEKRKKKLGSETTLRYVLFFSTTTLIPSILIALFSLILFNVGLQNFFDNKIKSAVNNSAEVAKNYVEETRNTIESDIVLMQFDLNSQSILYYEKPNKFLQILTTQRLLRKLDEVHLIDSSGILLMSNTIDTSLNYFPPPEEAIIRSLEGKPIRINDPNTNRSSALIKLNNFIDTYLYVVKFMDPNVIKYLKQTSDAVSFYYNVQENKSGIKITFVIIYLLIVSLLLFLSIIIAINFATRLTIPLINLITASEKISLGDLNAKVPKSKTDKDFMKLNENFNSMIEKLKQQQDKLLAAERYSAWETVARKLAHEIKNPLTPIQLSIDIIREKYLKKLGDEEKLSKYLNTITKQIKDIEYLLNEFSDFARMPKPIFKKIDINEIINRSVDLHKNSDHSINFIKNAKRSRFFLDADEEQLNRVFINLIKNAMESINEKKIKKQDFKGKIELEIKDDNDYIYVIIKDNGVGFDKIDQDKMLTPYFTTKQKGTGLGLAIVTKIISDHNSVISFKSINDGAKVEIAFTK